MTVRRPFLSLVAETAGLVSESGGAFSGEAAAHVHLASATGTRPGEKRRYVALPPRRVEAIFPFGGPTVSGVEPTAGAVADVLRARLDLFSTRLPLGETPVPVLSAAAVAAHLLAQGGLSLGLLGIMLRLVGPRSIDVDEVREILKAARQGERFQPLLELLDVA